MTRKFLLARSRSSLLSKHNVSSNGERCCESINIAPSISDHRLVAHTFTSVRSLCSIEYPFLSSFVDSDYYQYWWFLHLLPHSRSSHRMSPRSVVHSGSQTALSVQALGFYLAPRLLLRVRRSCSQTLI